MTDIYTEQNLALIVLGDDDLRCQSTHEPDDFPGGDNCTIDVVAVKEHCERSFFICLSSYEWNLRLIEAEGWLKCDGCHRPIRDCWKIRPI